MTSNENHTSIPWDDVVRELSPGLLSYFAAVFPRHIAAELVQDALLRLVIKVRAGHFDPTKGSLRMYAYGIARYVRLEGRKVETTYLSVRDPDDLPSPGDDDRSDAQVRLRKAVTLLKPVEQEVILLLLDRDLSLNEISKLMQMPLGTIKSHIHRAKVTLKELLLADARD